MCRQSLELWIRPSVSENLRIARRDDASSLPFESSCDYRRAAASSAGARDLVNKLNQIIGQPNGNLPAHPKMVPNW